MDGTEAVRARRNGLIIIVRSNLDRNKPADDDGARLAVLHVFDRRHDVAGAVPLYRNLRVVGTRQAGVTARPVCLDPAMLHDEVAKFQTGFYADATDAVFKALGVG
jgi:hypothetical protein